MTPRARPAATRAFIIHTQELMRAGLRALLETAADVTLVGDAPSHDEALPIILQLKPDLVLLDLRTQDEYGLETAGAVRRSLPTTHVLVLADRVTDRALLSAVAVGAQGYVLQESDTETLMQAVRTVMKGRAYLDPLVTQHTFEYLRKCSGRAPGSAGRQLTPQEERLLPLIAQGQTNKEIAVTLGLSEKTVKNYLANVFSKLQVTRRAQAVAHYLTPAP